MRSKSSWARGLEPSEYAVVTASTRAIIIFTFADFAEDPGFLRINAVAPGWVSETLVALKRDPSAGVPAARVAQAYVKSVEGSMTGQIHDVVGGTGS